MFRGKLIFLIVVLLAWQYWIPGTAHGTVYTWKASGDGDWSNHLNWDPDGVPNEGDNAIIDNKPGQNVTVNGGGNKVTILKIDSEDTLVLSGGMAICPGPAPAMVINNGTIRLEKGYFGPYQTPGAVPLMGSGTVELTGGPTNCGIGGTLGGICFVNYPGHTIRGTGRISDFITNQGQIIACNGTLEMINGFNNQGGTISVSGPDGVLHMFGDYFRGEQDGQINPEDGLVKLGIEQSSLGLSNIPAHLWDLGFGPGQVMVEASSIFSNTMTLNGTVLNVNNNQKLTFTLQPWATQPTPVLVNNGTVNIGSDNEGGYLDAGNQNVLLTGSGKLVLGTEYLSVIGNSSSNGSFINDTNHTIQGQGVIVAPVNNKGQIMANQGTLMINSLIFGNGMVSVANNAILDVEQNLQAGDFIMSSLATLNVASARTMDLKGNFSFAQTDPSKWNWSSNSVIKMSGSAPVKQSLEVGGKDYRQESTGFINNFSIPHLLVSGNQTYVYLADLIDNGHRASPEALYVESLQVEPGATLNLNCLHLYTYLSGTVHQVKYGEGNLFGGGTIINVSVKPGPRSIPAIVTPLLLD